METKEYFEKVAWFFQAARITKQVFFRKFILTRLPIKSGVRSYGGLQNKDNKKVGNPSEDTDLNLCLTQKVLADTNKLISVSEGRGLNDV